MVWVLNRYIEKVLGNVIKVWILIFMINLLNIEFLFIGNRRL